MSSGPQQVERRRLPIGVKWTLRFTLVMMIVVLAMGYTQYRQLKARFMRDAQLLLELQVNEVQETASDHPWASGGAAAVSAYVDQHVESAEPELNLGIRVWSADGELLLRRGSFLDLEIPALPLDKLPQTGRATRVVDVGRAYPYTVMAAPIEGGWVEVAIDERTFDQGAAEIRGDFLLALPFALVATGLLSWVLARGSLAPIAQITETARRITATQPSERIPVSGNGDELDQLAATLNEMIGRISASVERLQAFSGNAAHQLRTPISRLRNRLEVAGASSRDARADTEMIEAALVDVDRLAAAVTGMLRLAESDTQIPQDRRQRIELGVLVGEIVEFFEPIASEKGVELDSIGSPGIHVAGDPEWLTEMFSNLVDNAIKFTPPGGRVSVEIAEDPDGVRISVRDTGCGFPAGSSGPGEAEVHLRAGPAGLGLPIAREIARAHGGQISLESIPAPNDPWGTTATVRLPSC